MSAFWEVWTTVMLWSGTILCFTFGAISMLDRDKRRLGLPTLFLMVGVLGLIQLGVLPS